tara:strand:+ start:376 stop:594 length:219 start_codon:yes stop_codon:yes gene_type:complete
LVVVADGSSVKLADSDVDFMQQVCDGIGERTGDLSGCIDIANSTQNVGRNILCEAAGRKNRTKENKTLSFAW